jgi:hypothetical protein
MVGTVKVAANMASIIFRMKSPVMVWVAARTPAFDACFTMDCSDAKGR